MSLHNKPTEATEAEMGVPRDTELMIPNPLPCRRWSEEDWKSLDVALTPKFVVEKGNLLKRLFTDGELDSLKGYLKISPERILAHRDYAPFSAEYESMPLDARVGALVAKIHSNDGFTSLAGAKVLHSNPVNRERGIPRQSSEIVVKDQITGATFGSVEGTSISNARTAYYAILTWDAFFQGQQNVKVLIIGSGEVAKQNIAILNHHASDRITSVVVCSPRSSQKLVDEMQSSTEFPLRAINDLDATLDLSEADFVITVTSNAKTDPPVVASKDKMKPNVVMLSLGTNEQPVDFIEETLKQGITVCDTIVNVSSRDAQALALYFSKVGKKLETEAAKYGVLEIFHLDGVVRSEDQPVLVACSGLAVMDIWYAWCLLGSIARAAGYDPLQ